jgi:hypothetical protein
MKLFIIMVMMWAMSLTMGSPVLAETALDRSGNLLERSVGSKSTVGFTEDLTGLIGAIVKGVLGFVGTAFLVLTIYGGILWMTASGREEQVESAKKVITSAIIGVAITMAAYAITYFITARLQKVGESPTPPKYETPAKAVVCGQETSGPTGTCLPMNDCAKEIIGSTCGQDVSQMCCAEPKEVCGQEKQGAIGTCRTSQECTKQKGTAIRTSTCGKDITKICCTD